MNFILITLLVLIILVSCFILEINNYIKYNIMNCQQNKKEYNIVEFVKVQTDDNKILELVREYKNNNYTYYMLDGTYVYDLLKFVVINTEPMNKLFFKNQDMISYIDIEEPAMAMRSCDLEKTNYFKN